ncbi:MAG: trypsin-like peptidase domain-containing protein [Limisphaerales bacterium]
MKKIRVQAYCATAVLLCGMIAAAPTSSAKDVSTPLELARQLNQAFIDVAEQVSPAVVVITVTYKPKRGSPMDEDNPLYDMLPRQFHKKLNEPPPSQGSGVVLRQEGYILTNSHVVEDADKIKVRFKDGAEYEASVRGVDPQSDVAIIKIDPRGKKLTVAKLADSSKTHVGEFAIAIGAPFELDYTVTYGHVSAKGRRVFSDMVMMDQDFIQTDASINPGNSGGPLVNIDGEVIGINTLIRGLHTGIGFAVPSNLAHEVADRLIADGKFTRSWLGVKIATLSEYKEYKNLVDGVNNGVVITGIMPDSPAAQSNLTLEDVVIAVDGKPVATAQDLKNEIRLKRINQSVSLEVIRDGKRAQAKVKIGEMPEETVVASRRQPRADEAVVNNLGLKVQTATRELAEQFSVEMASGVMVTEVAESSPADKSGIKPGDIITRINRKSVASPREFNEALKGTDLKKGVVVNLIGEGGRRFEILKDGGD